MLLYRRLEYDFLFLCLASFFFPSFYPSLGQFLRTNVLSTFPKTFSRNFLYFHIFQFFKNWEKSCSIRTALIRVCFSSSYYFVRAAVIRSTSASTCCVYFLFHLYSALSQNSICFICFTFFCVPCFLDRRRSRIRYASI